MMLGACSDDFTEIAPTGALSDEALQNATGVDLENVLTVKVKLFLQVVTTGGPM